MEPRDLDRAAAAMAAAFADDGLYRYFIGDEDLRGRFLERFLRFRLRYGAAKGTVLVTDDCAGVAVWLPPGTTMTPWDPLRFGGLRAMLLCGKADRTRIMGFNSWADERMAQTAPAPHWHLSPICVAPAAQRKGVGRALMERGLDLVQAGGAPCCLETQSRGSAAFYAAMGFRTLAEDTVPGTDLPHILMIWP